MYISVKLLNGFKQPLWYSVPQELEGSSLCGALVKVPLKNKEVTALVMQEVLQKPEISFAIRPAIGLEQFPRDVQYGLFLEQLSNYYQIEPLAILKRIRHFLDQAAKNDEIMQATSAVPVDFHVILTQEQQDACMHITHALTHSNYEPILLHGVTGSGKTEVYKHAICTAIASKKNVLLLLPEVTLALNFEKILRAQLPNITFFGFHSATSPREKKNAWQALMQDVPFVLIGVHLPALLPIPNLGLIIVDEEHEVGYQEKKHPKINTKEAALLRAYSTKIPIILGSATPSISSLYNVHTKGWKYLTLKNRFAGNFPTIQTVLLSDKKQRRNFWLSKELEDALRDRLAKKEQAIIFLNRRGFSLFVQCSQCSFIFTCSDCSVSLTLHHDNTMACHYCNYTCILASCCPQCMAAESKFLKKGIGTQQVVTILEKYFPTARVGRADLDVSAKKKVWQKTLHDFEQGHLDILVGTQTITKGLHFPRVTLVGILWADLNLHFPIYNASETALQQLVQVAGRAGRQSPESLVIVQAMAEHRVFEFLDERNYHDFYTQEIEYRTLLGYPPGNRLVELELKHDVEAVIEKESLQLMRHLTIAAQKYSSSISVLGPAKPVVHTIKRLHARKIYLKGSNIAILHQVFQTIPISRYKSAIFFTPNPIT